MRGVRRGLGTALLTFSVPTHSFVDLLAIAPIFRRKLHDRDVNISIDHQKALVRLFSRDLIARILQGEERLPLRYGIGSSKGRHQDNAFRAQADGLGWPADR